MREDGSVWTWGSNTGGRIGDGTITTDKEVVTPNESGGYSSTYEIVENHDKNFPVQVVSEVTLPKNATILNCIALGNSVAEVETNHVPFRTLNTAVGRWSFYGSYEDFTAVFYNNEKAAFIYTNKTEGNQAGSAYIDTNDANKQYGVSIGVVPENEPEVAEILIFEFTNAFRGSHALYPLEWSSLLADAAKKHSLDMAERNFFDHTNPDGKEAGDRITQAGYTWNALSENISNGYIDAVSTVDAWINSAGHRNNLLTQDCRELGVGWFVSSTTGYQTYATQNFGSR
jgi:uncharacterized protein YkwD